MVIYSQVRCGSKTDHALEIMVSLKPTTNLLYMITRKIRENQLLYYSYSYTVHRYGHFPCANGSKTVISINLFNIDACITSCDYQAPKNR